MANPLHLLTDYTYSTLGGPHSFRLLRFVLSPEDSDHIHCTIEEYDRGGGQCPPYTALSYAWGDVKTTVPITLNGRMAHVTENLREALLHLRHIRPYVLLWVDALSINQGDLTERGHQVSQMRAIYSEASSVISWLGQGTHTTDRLFVFMRSHHYSCIIHGGLPSDCGYTVDRELADALRYLEERPYWSRIWVIQEIVVASSLEVMCGDESVMWSIFVRFWPLIFEDHLKKVQGMNRRLAPPTHSSAILPLISWRRTGIYLAHALELTGLCRASDGRDKVYALLGLVDQGAGPHITVNYTISPCSVFLTATQTIIRDWNDSKSDVRHKLRDMLSQIDTEPTSGQRFKNFSAGSRASPIPECNTIAHLRQYIRFMLGYSEILDLDKPQTTDETWVCDGERCGSWAAMYKAATIHKDFKNTWNTYMRANKEALIQLPVSVAQEEPSTPHSQGKAARKKKARSSATDRGRISSYRSVPY